MVPVTVYETYEGGTRIIHPHFASLDGGPLYEHRRFSARCTCLPHVKEWAEGAKDG